jgi:hypothetical protein
MPRPPGVQITRDRRKDGSITFSLRVRISGADTRLPLGNTNEGWDEIRADTARKQLLAKIELGQWTPSTAATSGTYNEEPTFRELATDWLEARKRNPAIRPRTIQFNETQLKRYLAPFFGELLPSQITLATIKRYRRASTTRTSRSATPPRRATHCVTDAPAKRSVLSATPRSIRRCGHSR